MLTRSGSEVIAEIEHAMAHAIAQHLKAGRFLFSTLGGYFSTWGAMQRFYQWGGRLYRLSGFVRQFFGCAEVVLADGSVAPSAAPRRTTQ